jgi:hypothetical protein
VVVVEEEIMVAEVQDLLDLMVEMDLLNLGAILLVVVEE